MIISASVAGLILSEGPKNLFYIVYWDIISEIYRRSTIKSI